MHPELEALRALGLTEYAARAYRALVSLGPSEATTIASAAPVPRTKVYAVLADLVKRGWVDGEGGRPRRYRARRPQECFDRERARVDALLDGALPSLEAQHHDRSTRFGGPLWLLQGEDVVAQRTLEMVQRAKKEAFLAASFPLAGDEKALARAMRDALRRGVRVRVAVPTLETPHARAFAQAGAEVRVVPPLPPRLLFVDGREAMVAFPLPSQGGKRDVRAIWNPAPELLEMMGIAVQSVWSQADLPSAAPHGPAPRPRGAPERG